MATHAALLSAKVVAVHDTSGRHRLVVRTQSGVELPADILSMSQHQSQLEVRRGSSDRDRTSRACDSTSPSHRTDAVASTAPASSTGTGTGTGTGSGTGTGTGSG